MAATGTDPIQKIALVLKPLIEEMTKSLDARIVMTSQDVTLAIQQLEMRIQTLERLTSDAKKKPVRGEKKAIADKPAAEGAVEVVAAPTTAVPGNKLAFFRLWYKTNEEFRKKYTLPELVAAMEADPQVSKKTTEEARIAAQATFCWQYIKKSREDVMADITKDFTEVKAKSEMENKPAQQTVEERST
jgi:hypothetical protein